MRSISVAVLALILGSATANSAEYRAKQEASKVKSAEHTESAKSSSHKMSKEMSSVDEDVSKKLSSVDVGSKKGASSKKFVFDPMHVHLGKDKKMHLLKQSIFLNEMKAAKHEEANKNIAPSAYQAKHSLRTEEKRRRLSDGLWDSIVSTFSMKKTSITSLDEEGVDAPAIGANESVPDVPVADPPAAEKEKPHEPEEKPKKRAQIYFESKMYGGNANCEIKHNTFFSSHTYGIDACFLSSLSEEDFPIYTASQVSEVLDLETDMKEAYNVLTKVY